jgi:hypothetical protein
VHHHAGLREREGAKRAHGKQRDQPIGDAAEGDEQDPGEAGQEHDAHRMDQPPPLGGEGMGQEVVIGDQAAESSPEAWTFVKKWLRTRLDSRLHDLLEALSREYLVPDDWRGLRQFVGKIISSLPSKAKRKGSEVRLDYQDAEEQEERRKRGRPATERP